MSSTSDAIPGPDLHPIYPNPDHVASLLAADSGLSTSQKAELVAHCLARSCVFGDISALTFLLTDPRAQAYIDLDVQGEDGTGLVSLTIQGFGTEFERDIEREECVRLLIAHGANANLVDNAGWTALHHAALLSPPTLLSYLMTHGCSLFSETRRNLLALDIITAHSTIPGREDVALLLGEAMRGEGWSGGAKEERRRLLDERNKRRTGRKDARERVGEVLGVVPSWWGDSDSEEGSSDSESEDENADFTPRPDYTTMLAYSPPLLPEIFNSLITNFPPTLDNADPANALYMLVRFACLTCDENWLEDLIIGATDAIDDTFFSQQDDITCLIFWLHNLTLWLHLMKCDDSINGVCDALGSFEIIEEMINSVFVFIIRFAERKIDELIDSALLKHLPTGSDLDSVRFESDWSFLRPFGKKKSAINSTPVAPLSRTPDPLAKPQTSPPTPPTSASSSKGFSSSIRETFTRTRNSPSISALNAIFADVTTPSPSEITTFMTALHSLLLLSKINPVFITQLWSQVMYWTSCEIFNRILTRKKYLCRSRAIQISVNVGSIEEWIGEMGLPRGVQSHFVPVRTLLNWLQCLSSITEFSVLVATIQNMKVLNPLQMRRAVRDYKYEVNEGRMPDECVQYLTQLQKDWEQHRVKEGVAALRKEMSDRDHDRESVSSFTMDTASSGSNSRGRLSAGHRGVDSLFERSSTSVTWEPPKPPPVLGELLDSRYMLPLLFPSDPRMLSAGPGKLWASIAEPRRSRHSSASNLNDRRRGVDWRARNRRVREIGVNLLQWVDGINSASRWTKQVPLDASDDEFSPSPTHSYTRSEDGLDVDNLPHITPLTRKPSTRSRGRQSLDTILAVNEN